MIQETAFRTVFDASQGDGAWVPLAGGVMFVCAGALMVFRPALMRPWLPNWLHQGRARTFFSWVFLVFSLGWTVAAFADAHNRNRRISNALEGGRSQIVEGFVTNYVPMPESGHSPTGPARESFTVGGASFSYTDFSLTGGFRNTASHGGPIREGLYVRVTYIGKMILRLEVADPS
jgi:hypothetical protein